MMRPGNMTMRHDETWKLKSEPRQDIQMPRLNQDRDMETRHVFQDSVTDKKEASSV